MKGWIHSLLLKIAKLIFAGGAMTCLYFLLVVFAILAMGSPGMSPEDSAARGRAIGWILVPALQVIAVYAVSSLLGLLFPGDRWIIRPAAVIPAFLFLLYLMIGLLDTAKGGLRSEVYPYVVMLIVPVIAFGVVAFLFAPFFHSCGRRLRDNGRRINT